MHIVQERHFLSAAQKIVLTNILPIVVHSHQLKLLIGHCPCQSLLLSGFLWQADSRRQKEARNNGLFGQLRLRDSQVGQQELDFCLVDLILAVAVDKLVDGPEGATNLTQSQYLN